MISGYVIKMTELSKLPPELVEEFKCGICLDLLIKPITLPCGHTFCEACITDSWKCSFCRKEYQNSDNFTTNTILNKILPTMVEGYKERLENYERDLEYKRLLLIYQRSSRCQYNTEIINNLIGNRGIHYSELLNELRSYEQLEVDLNLAFLLKNSRIMIVGDYVVIIDQS